ncbi:MAG: PEGA domain-containing protein [Polyangiales bacterium]
MSFPAQAAEQTVVLGPTAASGFSEADGELARDALADSLRMQGLTVTEGGNPDKHGSRSRGCDPVCGARLLATTSADLSAWVKLSKTSAAISGSASVTLLDSAGHRYEGSAEVRDGDVRDATTRAVLEARSYQLLGPGPWLRVIGTPEGAEVTLDGDRVGTVPYRAPIAPGRHEIIVRETGYERLRQTLEVPDDDSRKVEVTTALEPMPLESPQVATPLMPQPEPEPVPNVESSDNTWLAAPVGIGMLGLGLAAAVSVRIATGVDGCVDQDDGGLCTAQRRVRLAPTIGGYALSALLLGGSITWIVLGLQRDAARERDAAHVRQSRDVQVSFGLGQLAVSGTF